MPIEIKITVNDAGQMNVSGFPTDRIITYGLLKLAEITVAKFFDQQQDQQQREQLIQTPRLLP